MCCGESLLARECRVVARLRRAIIGAGTLAFVGIAASYEYLYFLQQKLKKSSLVIFIN